MNGSRLCAFSPERENRQLHNPTAKTESFIRSRSPDVYAMASYRSAGIADNILATERTGFQSDASAQRQYRRIGGN